MGAQPFSRFDYRRALRNATEAMPDHPSVQSYRGRRFFFSACDRVSPKVPILDRQILSGHTSGFRMTMHYTVADVEGRRWIVTAIAKLLGLI